MPREVVTIQVGQCGNQLGLKWWDLMHSEHKEHREAIDSLFYEDTRGPGAGRRGAAPQLKARCVPIDMEEGVLSSMMRGPLANLFDTTHFVSDVSGAGNNWAVGHMEYGDKYVDEISRSVSNMVEKCDSLQTFVIMHSLSGGTGSGLGTRLLSMLEDEYPHVFRFCNVVMPSEVDDVVIAPYNSCFALRELVEHADCVIPLDNDALATMADRSAGKAPHHRSEAETAAPGLPAHSVADPTQNKKLPYDTMNAIAAQMMSNLTCSMRFPGTLNMDVNEVTTNLVPYPRLHFLLSAIAPLNMGKYSQQGSKHVDSMFQACLEKDHQLVNCPSRESTTLACAMIARGADVSVADMSRNLPRVRERLRMVHWNSDGFKTALCSVPPLNHKHSLLMLTNSCAMSSKFTHLRDRFMKLYSVRSHVHHYEQYLEQSYFDGTMNILNDVIADYEFLNTLEPPRTAPRTMRDLLVL